MKYSKYLDLEELVPQQIFSQFAGRSAQFLDHRAGELLDRIRELVDEPIRINDWHTGGIFSQSGFRMPDTLVGGKLSQHKFGRGFDLKISLTHNVKTYEEFRKLIKDNFEELNKLGLTTIEMATPTWLHIDLRFTGLDYLYEVPYR